PNQLRPPHVELRPLLRADGSARFKFGNSSVLAAVFGPREPRSRAREVFDRATLDVVVRPRTGIPGPAPSPISGTFGHLQAERQLEAYLARQLDHVIVHTDYPRTQISVVVQIACSDGATAAAAGNAAFLALLDAGVAMRATALSVSVAVRSGTTPILLLDPTEVEETGCDALITVAVDGSRGQMVSCISGGIPLDAPTWASCLEAATKSCKVLEAFIRMSLQKRLETFLKPG
ncbi:EXOSC5, partial [Symbiodinium sp. CCMP2456]